MKIFKAKISGKIIYLIILFSIVSSCNQFSEGLQRRKFEFLYKMNNFASLFREYTNDINYVKDLKFYEGRMEKFYEDINNMKTIDGYGTSRVFKEKFLTMIDINLKTINTFKQKKILESENIRKEYDIIMMNERIDSFINELNDEISKVGKE